MCVRERAKKKDCDDADNGGGGGIYDNSYDDWKEGNWCWEWECNKHPVSLSTVQEAQTDDAFVC